jgi:hypothetical protein
MWTPATLESVAKECRVPLFRIRAAAREFLDASLIEKGGDQYVVTVSGISRMEG